MSTGWLAVEVVQAGLDPLTGRTLSFNHVPMAAWAGHLCDLVLLGAVTDRGGLAVVAGDVDVDAVHPLVADAWSHLVPRLPRAWRYLFGPQTVDVNDVARDARTWLVDAGLWTRRHTVFGPRFTAVAESPPGAVAGPPGTEQVRQRLREVLAGLAQVGEMGVQVGTAIPGAADDDTGRALEAIVRATSDLIAWKAMNPQIPHGGM